MFVKVPTGEHAPCYDHNLSTLPNRSLVKRCKFSDSSVSICVNLFSIRPLTGGNIFLKHALHSSHITRYLYTFSFISTISWLNFIHRTPAFVTLRGPQGDKAISMSCLMPSYCLCLTSIRRDRFIPINRDSR